MGVSVRTGLPITRQFSAIDEHEKSTGHRILESQFKIIGRNHNNYHLRILESLHIYKTKLKLNTGTPIELAIVR